MNGHKATVGKQIEVNSGPQLAVSFVFFSPWSQLTFRLSLSSGKPSEGSLKDRPRDMFCWCSKDGNYNHHIQADLELTM